MVSNQIFTLDGITLSFSNNVRNIGVICDQEMSFGEHIYRITLIHLCILAKIRNILSQTLIHAIITSRL